MPANKTLEGLDIHPRGKWDREDPHMTYSEFSERSHCFYKRLKHMTPTEYAKRQQEYNLLCLRFPKYAARYEAEYRAAKNIKPQN